MLRMEGCGRRSRPSWPASPSGTGAHRSSARCAVTPGPGCRPSPSTGTSTSSASRPTCRCSASSAANAAEATRRAAELAVGPEVVGDLPESHTLITTLVPARAVDGDLVAGRLDAVVRVLRRFHRSPPLRAAFPVHRVVEWHARDAGAEGASVPAAYERLHQLSRRIEAAFAHAPMDPVPCHNNLVAVNLLFDDDAGVAGRLRVRWEQRRLLRPGQPERQLRLRRGGRRAPARAVLRPGLGRGDRPSAADEADERVPRGHVGRRPPRRRSARSRRDRPGRAAAPLRTARGRVPTSSTGWGRPPPGCDPFSCRRRVRGTSR